MSRPLRIEFKGAYYHVMNRGAGRQAIFPCDTHDATPLILTPQYFSVYKIC